MQGIESPAYEELKIAYSEGKFLDGKNLLERWAPDWDSQGAAVRLLVHRLFNQLGMRRCATQALFRLWRDGTGGAEVLYYVALSKLERRGLWHAFRWVEAHRPSFPMNHSVYPAYTALRARFYGQFRDFRKAHELLAEASTAVGNSPDPWLRVETSYVWLAQDRAQDALSAARQARDIRPNYLPAIMAEIEALLRLRQDRQALHLAQEHVNRVQSPGLAARFVELCIARDEWDKAREALQIAELYGRHADAPFPQWLLDRRSLVAYRLGRFQESRYYAVCLTGSEWHQDLAARLDRLDPSVRPVQLAVPYVPQSHLTCVPAALAALCRYWGNPVDPEEIAAAICYDGTPDQEERNWAEQRGFLAREFRVDWAGAKALLDAGIPFAVFLTFPRNGHVQAVIGYDPARETLLTRDPAIPGLVEVVAARFFEEQRPYGPRGLALVPTELESRLSALELPDADAYEHRYRLGRALRRNDRESAHATLTSLRQAHAGTDLTLATELKLAQFDLNWPAANKCCRQLLERYPAALRWRMEHLYILRQLNDEGQLRHALEGPAGKTHPEFWMELADHLLGDETRATEARLLLLRALRHFPTNALALGTLARGHLARREFNQALGLYRLAAACDDKNEAWWLALFRCSRQLGEHEPIISLLKTRAEASLAKSIEPLRTICRALVDLDRAAESFSLLDRALQERPEGSELQLLTAEIHAAIALAQERAGQLDLAEQTARETIRRAPDVPESRGLLAELLWKQGRRDEAYAEVWYSLERYPEYDWGWSRIERCPAVLEKTEEALQRTREFVNKHPKSVRPALSLLAQLDATGFVGRDEALQAVTRLLDRHPKLVQGHDWRAYLLTRDQWYDAALEACAPTIFEGEVPAALQARSAWVEWQAGRRGEAIGSMLRAVKADPNNAWGFGQLTRWALEEENSTVAVDAAARWVKLQPNSADAWYHRGQALARSGQFEQAIAAYRRALELAPADEPVALTLLEEFLRFNLTSEAESFVRDLEARHTTTFVASCRCVLIARTAPPFGRPAKAADVERALQEFEVVCAHSSALTPHLERAADALVAAGWQHALTRKARTLAFQAHPLPAAAAVWIKYADVGELSWRLRLRPHPLPAQTGVRPVALKSLLEKAVAIHSPAFLGMTLRRFRSELRGDPHLYGIAGFALTRLGRYRSAVNWLRDATGRNDVQPWMLWNLVISLLITNRAKEALPVARRALTLRVDHTAGPLRSIAALLLVRHGHWQEAREELSRLSLDRLKGCDRAAAFLSGCILDARDRLRENPSPRHAARECWQKLQARVDAQLGSEGAMQDSVLANVIFREVRCALNQLARRLRVPARRLRTPPGFHPVRAPFLGSGRLLVLVMFVALNLVRACHFDDQRSLPAHEISIPRSLYGTPLWPPDLPDR